MEKVLHRYHAGVVGEQAYAIFSTGFSACIAQRTHFIGIVVECIKSAHTGTGSRFGWTLADGIHANVLFLAVVVSKRTREALQQRFCIGHFTIIREGTLGGDITEAHDATPFVHGVFFH